MAHPENFRMVDEDGATKSVDVTIGHFGNRAEKTLKNYFGKWSLDPESAAVGGEFLLGNIEEVVITNCVKSLSVDGEAKDLRKGNTSVLDNLPELYDPEDYESIIDRLIRLSVKHNPRLGRHQRFAMVFGAYLPQDLEAGNPTEGSATSTSTTSSSSESGQEETSSDY